MDPSPITLWRVVLIFVIYTFKNVRELSSLTFLVLSLGIGNMTFVLKMFDSLDLHDVLHFDSLIFSNIFLCNFLLVYRQVGLIFFCVFRSSVLIFCRNSLYGLYLANSECDAYLAVGHSLVYNSYPKMFLLFFILILSLV